MKKIVESKTGKLIITILITLILFNFIVPTYSHATGEWAGKLIEPLADLTCSIGDALMNTMQSLMMPGSPVAVTKRSIFDDIAQQDGDYSFFDKIGNFFGKQASSDTSTGTVIMEGAGAGSGIGAALGAVIPAQWLTVPAGAVIGGVVGGLGAWATRGIARLFAGNQIDERFNQQVFPAIAYSPIAIFSNKIPALDINFLNPGSNFEDQYYYLIAISELNSKDEYKEIAGSAYGIYDEDIINQNWELAMQIKEARNNPAVKEQLLKGGTVKDTEGNDLDINSLGNTAMIIGPIISKWYVALRNIAIVGLMIVLLYIGIRILISSASEEKAKYKTMIKDWAIAFVLVFFIHYIMLAMLTITDAVTNMLSSTSYKEWEYTQSNGITMKRKDITDVLFNNVRMRETELRSGQKESETGWLDTFGYAAMYVTLVFYTIIFTFKFLKRVVYMAFLTLIAPMVALTYPLDKINDKRAQAFGYWFKEYTFNLLIAPIDLILYLVLVGSAIDFAKANILYGLVAIGFILETEDIIKAMFGIRAEGGAFGSSFAAGALFSSGLHMLDRITSGAKGLITGSRNDKNKNNENDEDEGINEMDDPDATISLGSFNSGDEEEPEAIGEGDEEHIPEEGDPDFIGPPRPPEEEIPQEGDPDFIGPPRPEDYEEGEEELMPEEGDPDFIGPPRPEDYEENMPEEGDPDFIGPPRPPEEGEDAEHIPQEGDADFIGPPRPPEGGTLGAAANQGSQPSRFRRSIRGIRKVAGRYINTKNGDRLARFALKSGARIVAGTAGAAVLGTMGLAAGLASKEGFSGVAKYTTAGAVSGATLGAVGANIGMAGVDAAGRAGKTAVKDYQSEYYSPEERRRRRNEKIEKEFYSDRDNINYYKNNWGAERYKEKMDQAVMMKRYGINKQNQIDKALKLMDKMPDLTEQQAATAVKMAENTSQAKLRNLKDRREIMESAAAAIPNEQDRNKFMTALDQYHGIDESDSRAYNAQVTRMQREEREQRERLERERMQQQEQERRENERAEEENQRQLENNTREQQNQERMNERRNEQERNNNNNQNEDFIDPQQRAAQEDNINDED